MEKTSIYFLSEITKNYGNGDCILLENYDINGNIIHALIDTGRKVYNGVVCKFLQKHKVKKLDFLLITHSHSDHNGDTISVIEKYKIDKLIMKEFDLKWSPDGTQKLYENILEKAINKKIEKILGISYISLISDEYSPSRSENFKNIIKDAKQENFEYFNKENVNFKFGSSFIQVLNWEIYDSEGNLFVTGENKNEKKIYRDIYTGENQNSLCVLLTQGNKKVILSGDMNNIKKNIGKDKIGDEDRLKNIIGKIDLLKLGHHGYQHSNTADYINILKPEYVVITNDVDRIFSETKDYLEKNKINYLYTTQDEYEISAIISNNDIELGFGTCGIKNIKDKIFYISEENKYKNYLKFEFNIKYNIIEKNANNWKELKDIIERNNEIKITEKFINIDALKINLCSDNNNNCYIADSCININNHKKIILINNEKELIILRDKNLINFPLFYMEKSILILGEENMKGKIKLDGNKDNVSANSNIIKMISSKLSIYNNITICNNLNKSVKRSYTNSDLSSTQFYGSAIHAINSEINMFGGEISNNIHELFIDEKNNESKLPEILDKDFLYCVRGAGIFMHNKCTFNMYNGKITNNKGINNSCIYSNINSSCVKTKNSLIHQNCRGIGIFASNNSEIYLHKGEISNNTAINNGKINFISPKNDKNTKISEIFSCIYGAGIYSINSKFEMSKDFILENNFCELNSNINMGKNCNVEKAINSAIRGGQIYFNNSQINIKGGLIDNGKNESNIKHIFEDKDTLEKKLSTDNQGGGIYFFNCKNIEIHDLKIKKCNAVKGGAMFLTNCIGIITDSLFEGNFAKGFGGGIFIHGNNSDFQLINNQILNNITNDGSGGGIYAFGQLLIDGEKTLISDNIAGTYGGGIMIKYKTVIKNGKICHNKALKNSGGGIRIDGSLELINGKICKNWANMNGGGINHEPTKNFICDKDKINSMVYRNNANKLGNDIFPLQK